MHERDVTEGKKTLRIFLKEKAQKEKGKALIKKSKEKE